MSEALANSPFAPGLRALTIGVLDAITPSTVDVNRLVKASPGLQLLDIAACQLTADDARVIASAKLNHLRALPLIGPMIGEDGLEAILSSSKLKKLRWFDLMDAENAARFAGPMKIKPQRLSLSRSNLANTDVPALFESEHLADLKYLDLSFSRHLTASCLAAMVRSPVFANLNCLRLTFWNRFSKSGFERLVRAWKDLNRPPGNLCLPIHELPRNVVTDLRKRYGKHSFVAYDKGAYAEHVLDTACRTLRPNEDLSDILDRWKTDGA